MHSARQRLIRQQRHREAVGMLDHIRDVLRFDQITVVTYNADRHWQFLFGQQLLLDYWPSAAKCRQIRPFRTRTCRSPVQASRLAAGARSVILEEVRRALQATPVGAARHE
jgi:hypothetical protein